MEKKQILTQAAELFDLPADLVAGLCHMEMLGDRELFLEGHGGILSYGTEQIDISVSGRVLRVRGEGLALVRMTEREARIRGTFFAVEWL